MNYRWLSTLALAATLPVAAQAAVSISVNIAPPVLPVYVQPAIPAAGYIWTPGYWRWDPIGADYFWVPGTWVAPPSVGLLWTPGYWGWGGGGYLWHGGYWGPHVGFYGGVNYGFGYGGVGYHGGYWQGGVFNYNRSVNNINTTIVHNVYNERVAENTTRVSFNGGNGGIAARESAVERAARTEQHVAPTSVQRQHEQVAMRQPEQRAAFNHGSPTMAAVARPQGVRGGAPEPHGPAGADDHGMRSAEGERGGGPREAAREAPQHAARGPEQHGGGGEHRGGGHDRDR